MENVTITNVIIQAPDRKCDWGVNDVIPGSDGLGISVIFEKKQLVKIWTWVRAVKQRSMGWAACLLESVSWSWSCSSRQWEPTPSRGLRHSGPLVEQPSRMRKKCCYSQRNLGSICCSLFSLQLTFHTQPFHNPFATLSNKVWEVYFSKEVCSFVIIVDYVSAYIYIRIVVSWLYEIINST